MATLSRLALLLMLSPATSATAQHLKKLRCPPPSKTESYLPPPANFLELSAGLSKAFMYRNSAPETGEHFRFSSGIAPYISATGHVVLGSRLEIFAGAVITQSRQGLAFGYSSGPFSFSDDAYASSIIIRMPIGLAVNVTPWLKLSAAPYVGFSSYYESGHTSSSSSNGSGQVAYRFDYTPQDETSHFLTGLDAGLRVRLTRRLGVAVNCAIDATRSTASYGTAYLNDFGGTDLTFKGAVEPYVVHTSLCLSYKFLAKDD